MTDNDVKKIQAAIKNGDRVMVVPVKGGVRVFIIRKEEIK